MPSAWGFDRRAWHRFGAGFQAGLGGGALTLPRYYADVFRVTGLRTMGKSMWADLAATPFTAGMWTGTAATAGALMMGVPMALGGAYDLVTGRRRNRLAGLTSMAAGVALAGLPFYGPGLYRWARPRALNLFGRIWR